MTIMSTVPLDALFAQLPNAAPFLLVVFALDVAYLCWALSDEITALYRSSREARYRQHTQQLDDDIARMLRELLAAAREDS